MLAFDQGTHTYRLDGKVVPSVTQVLECLHDWSRVPRDLLEAKRQLGTAVHIACELDDANDLVEESVHESVRGYLEGYRKFKREMRPEVLAVETKVANHAMHYAGTLDRVLGVDGIKWLVDLKSCTQVHAPVGPQTAAYLAALGDPSITRRAALQLKPDGTYKFHPLNDPSDIAVFMACLTVHRFKEKHQ